MTAEGIYGLDRNGCCTFINSSAARLLGYAVNDLLGREMHSLIHHHYPDGREYPRAECPTYLASVSGAACRSEGDVFWRSDGSRFPVSFFSSPLLENGVNLGTVVTFSDITDRKETEARVLAAWDQDRNVAEALQRALLPEVPETAFDGLAVATRYQAARQEARIGGDFFDAFAVDEGRVAFAVGDASGKGLGAAVRTAEAKFALRVFLREDPSPSLALSRLNNLLCASQRLESRDDDKFIVLTLAVVSSETGSVEFATAAPSRRSILRGDGGLDEVQTRGVPLGFLPRRSTRRWNIISRLVRRCFWQQTASRKRVPAQSFSVTTAWPPSLSSARVSSVSAALPLPVQEIAQTILDGAREFAGGVLHDDACLLLVRRL